MSTINTPKPLSELQSKLIAVRDAAEWLIDDIPPALNQTTPSLRSVIEETVISPLANLIESYPPRNCDVVLDEHDALHKFLDAYAPKTYSFSPLQLCQWMLASHSPSPTIHILSDAGKKREALLEAVALKVKQLEDTHTLDSSYPSGEDYGKETQILSKSLAECKTLLEALAKEVVNLKTQIGE